jgi:pseudaminic acid synthase
VNFLDKKLGKNQYPFIVAEISCNHEGNLQQARDLIYAAKEVGADAVKIQTYFGSCMTGDYISQNTDFVIKDGQWKGQNLQELYIKTGLGREEWVPALFQYADDIEIPFFSSVFSERGLKLLEAENCPAYKIASFEIVDLELIKAVAKTGKPIVISTGMASYNEIASVYANINLDNLILMHCVSAYPTKIQECNLWKVSQYKKMYTPMVGFSDHTRGVMAGPLAVAAGAVMLEKHLALPNTNPEDASFSLHPDEFKTYVQRCRIAAEAMMETECLDEQASRQFRRSLYVVKDIKKGEQFTNENIRCIRPSYGLSPHRYLEVLREKAVKDIKAGTALTEEMLL